LSSPKDFLRCGCVQLVGLDRVVVLPLDGRASMMVDGLLFEKRRFVGRRRGKHCVLSRVRGLWCCDCGVVDCVHMAAFLLFAEKSPVFRVLEYLLARRVFVSRGRLVQDLGLTKNAVVVALRELRQKQVVALYHSTRKNKFWGVVYEDSRV